MKQFENIEAPCIKEIRLQTNGEFGELQSLFACSQVKFTSARMIFVMVSLLISAFFYGTSSLRNKIHALQL